MSFTADYPAAIVVEAANYGYAVKNLPRGFVYHTPEEKADDDPQTPGYLAGTTREASYTYFDSYLGFIFQLVPEHEGAYANYVNGKPYPTWANPSVNLNLQGISIAFEGMAATIHKTMLRGRPQWTSGVALVAHRAKARNISPDSWARHSDVSVARSDPGSLDLVAFTLDVKAKMEEDDMTEDEVRAIFRDEFDRYKFVARDERTGDPLSQPHTSAVWAGSLVRHVKDSAKHAAGGIGEARAREIAQEEDDKLKVTK